MSKFTERIRLVFDVDTVNSKKGFSQFGKDIREAETLTGKMRAGVGSLSTMLKDNMGAAAIAGGAALVAFGVKAVGAFTDTAKAAIDMSKATGLSVEEASRLIAVGDDLGVSAEGLTAGLGKIAKTLDGTQWAKYGIATKDAGGNTRSTNDIFLDALETLGKISNETDRAAAGNELFGKGYANLAPIVGKTRAEMEDYLASVGDGQVITEAEAKKAERMRLAMDQLSDALGEVTLAVGGMVAGMAPAIERTADMIEQATKLEDSLGLVDKAMKGLDLLTPIGQAEAAWNGARKEGKRFADMTRDELIANVDKYVESTDDAAKAVEQWAAKNKPTAETLLAIYDALGLTVPAAEQSVAVAQEQAQASEDEAAARKKVADEAWAELDAKNALINSQLGLAGAARNYQDALDDLAVAVDDGTTSKDEYAEALDRTAAAAMATAAAHVEEQKAIAEAKGETYSAKDATDDQVKALEYLASGLAADSPLRKRLQEYIDTLKAIPGSVGTNVSLSIGGALSAGKSGGGMRAFAKGTSSAPAGVALVGENGPELVNFRGGESVTPAGQTARALAGAGGGDVYNITVNAMVADADAGRRIASALEAHKRNGGKLPS